TGEQSMLVDSKLLEPEEVELSEEEKALRERKRIAGRKGIVSYDWGTADTILVPLGGDLHLVTLPQSDGASYTIEIDDEEARQQDLSLADIQTQIDQASKGFGAVRPAAEDMENLVLAVKDDGVVRLSDVATIKPALREPKARQLTATDAFEYDAKVSPGGRYVSFVRDGAVYAIDLQTNKETRLTPLAEPDKAISYGVAEFVAQEEMSRYTGYWWSPDDRYLAYTRVNESTVDIIPRFDIAAEEVTVIEQRYPRAGRPNAIVDLFVRDMQTDDVIEVDWRRDDWGPATDQYLARVNWHESRLSVQRVNRDQTEISEDYGNPPRFNVSIPPVPGKPSFIELQDRWVNLSNDSKSYGVFGWLTTSEVSGFRHIKRVESQEFRNGKSTPPLTSGSWTVDAIAGSNHADAVLFFTGYRDTPLERHLYSVSSPHPDVRYMNQDDDGKYEMSRAQDPTRLTELGKSWSITMSPDGETFIGRSSSPTQPPQTGLYRVPNPLTDEELAAMGAKRLPDSDCIDLTPMSKQVTRECPDGMNLIAWVEENALDETHPYHPYLADHTTPEYGTLTAEDGQTLYYSIQTPPDFDPSQKYPVLVNVYGGPGVQTVDRDWERWDDQFYTRQGYIVFRLDNRGSANRGKKFEDVIYRQTGGPEVRDQLLGVEWLKSQPFVDADKIAIQGWSYGGYMTLMTILQAPEGTFKAAVSGAPVTDWTFYDTFYTERYMDTPQDNPDGYEKSSVFYHLDRLETEMPELLLIHGMADDNVTFDNTTRLMAELQERGIVFDLMTYPGQRHGIRGEKLRTHLMRTRMAFLDRHLKD
ncbi:MAG: DPP IV N-terminal domain-containing protein, partial [Pseudomonadota bacterium]